MRGELVRLAAQQKSCSENDLGSVFEQVVLI